MTEEEKDNYIKKLVQSNVDQQNKICLLSKKVYQLEKANMALEELKDRYNEEIELHQHAEDYIKSLEAQIEKLIDFVLSKTECCDVCPITDTCINSEGTCPYAGILSKGEEAVTREWLMQKIAKEMIEK